MRLIKAQTTNLRSIAGKGVKYDIDDQVIVDSQRAMKVPSGTLAQRPGQAGIITASANGQVRYNTSDNQLEVYQNGAWREIRFKEPNQDPGIIWQNLGTGDGTETVFGEVNSGDPDFAPPHAAEHILVLVENVIQIPTTNYTLKQTTQVNATGPNNPYTETDTGWWIEFTSPVPFSKPVTVIHNLDK